MEKGIVYYGSLDAGLYCFPSAFSAGRDIMTALAVGYDPNDQRFVIAADGRLAAATLPLRIKTDENQKISFVQTPFASLMCAMTGLAAIGPFDDLTSPVLRQIEMLAKRKFSDGYEFASKICSNLTRVLQKALDDGRITHIPIREDLPPEERGRLFTVYLVGFFRGVPFFRVSTFYFDEPSHRFALPRDQNPNLQNPYIIFNGSNTIKRMVMGEEKIDQRIAEYARDPNKTDVRTDVLNFVRASVHADAMAIDPDCWKYGGHIHAGELTKGGFAWLVPPAGFSIAVSGC